MTATKTLADVQEKHPDFMPRWKLFVNGEEVTGDWRVESKYGAIHSAVVMHPDGTPNFDRPAYREADHVNVIAYGWYWSWRTFWRQKELRIAVIRQPRPHADDPENPGSDHGPITFGQIPMGFMKTVMGETPKRAAGREVDEETGASALIGEPTQPAYPFHNPNPTFVPTWANLFFVEVDLNKIAKLRPHRGEPIYSAEYIPVRELLRRIREGKDEQGAVYRMCTSNSLWLIFFATHPELWQT